MLTVETIARVRREHARGKSVRSIARDLRLSRKTVTKYVGSGNTDARYERQTQPYPRLGPFLAELNSLLERNERQPRRDRLDKLQLFKVLQRAGYAGGYDAVRRYAKRWTATRAVAPGNSEAFIPLVFAPGEAYQFDWSEEWIVLAGVAFNVKVCTYSDSWFFAVAGVRRRKSVCHHAAGSSFSLAKGKVSMKVCIGVLP